MIRTLLLGTLFWTALPLAADTIKLKSGETLEGTIISETRTSVTIEVPFSATIMDSRTIAKSEIEAMSRLTKDEVAYAALASLENPRTALDASAYQDIKNQFTNFIKEFPNSIRLVDARERIAAIEEREARLAKGEVKFNGQWIPAKDYLAEKYQIEASVLESEMKRQLEARNPGGTLNIFEDLKKSYPNSIAYAESISTARKAVSDMDSRLLFELNNLPIKLDARAKTIERASLTDQPRVRQAMENEDARLKQIAEQATKSGRKFFPISSIDENGLKLMQKATDTVKTELARPELAKLESNVALARRTIDNIAAESVESARSSFDQLATAWPQFEALPRLKAKVEALEAKAASAAAPPSAEEQAPKVNGVADDTKIGL